MSNLGVRPNMNVNSLKPDIISNEYICTKLYSPISMTLESHSKATSEEKATKQGKSRQSIKIGRQQTYRHPPHFAFGVSGKINNPRLHQQISS